MASPIGVGSAAQPPRWKVAIPWSIALVIAAASGVGFWILTRPLPQPLKKFVITPSSSTVLTNLGPPEVAISPDGKHVVYTVRDESGQRLLKLRSLDDFVDRSIPGTENVENPFFSPGGQWVGFFANGKLLKVALAGGTTLTLYEGLSRFRGGSWDQEDNIVFAAAEGGLYRVSAAGGEAEQLAVVNVDQGEQGYRHPHILPGGKTVLFTIRKGPENFQIALLSLETGELKIVIENGRDAVYAPTGHLVYGTAVGETLMAAPFDLARLEVIGDPVPILERVRSPTGSAVDYAISDNGMLVYVPSTSTGDFNRTLVWVDREGQEEPLAAEPQGYQGPRISPDGSRLAITVNASGGSDVWIYDLEREILTRLTFDPAADHYPVWTPDGQRIVFDSGRAGAEAGHNLFWKAADGTGQVERLTTSPNNQTANSFSPDGKRLVFIEPVAPNALQVLSMEGERTSQPLFQSQLSEAQARISPDGHWIAYESSESGRTEIYVRPFPNVEEGKWQISRDGGISPVWAPRGQELFYRNGEAMMVVGINSEPPFTQGSPAVLFMGRYTFGGGSCCL